MSALDDVIYRIRFHESSGMVAAENLAKLAEDELYLLRKIIKEALIALRDELWTEPDKRTSFYLRRWMENYKELAEEFECPEEGFSTYKKPIKPRKGNEESN